MSPASWHALPTELHIAIVHLLPPLDTLALASTSRTSHALCLPTIFAAVDIPSAAALVAFARHVPAHYAAYIRSLSLTTKHTDPPHLASTDALVAVLASCAGVHTISLSLATPLNPESILPAFSRLINLHSLHIASSGREDVSPLSERLVVALAASLPSLAHLSLARITRSALHVDPCDVPYHVPLVMNDFDVPPHPSLGTNLSLPSLLRIPTLRSLEIRDTWLSCDAKMDHVSSSLASLLLTGCMYADDDNQGQACTAWIRASAPSLRTLHLGASLAVPLQKDSVLTRQSPLSLPHLSHLHINATRTTVDTLPDTLHVLCSSRVECMSITYNDGNSLTDSGSDAPPVDDFARQCALDDLEDWRDAIDTFLISRSNQDWAALRRVDISFGKGIHASWDL